MNDMSKALIGTIVAVFLFVGGMHVARADTYMVKDAVGNTLHINEKACADGKVMAFITMRGGNPEQFKSGVMIYEGKRHEACWAESQDGHIYVMDDGGDMSKIPTRMFQKVTDV